MQRVEKNIEEILDELNRTFHRLRQERIDGELFEAISGYESLSGPPPVDRALAHSSQNSSAQIVAFVAAGNVRGLCPCRPSR